MSAVLSHPESGPFRAVLMLTSSALLVPSLLFPMVTMAATRCGDDATFFSALLCPLGSEGQTQTPLVIDGAD